MFSLARLAIPHLRRGAGHLIIVSSQAGTHFFEGGAAYCATKAALRALAEVILLETRGSGMRTTLVSAGAISNRPKPDDGWKIIPGDAAEAIVGLVGGPSSAFVGEIELRPSRQPDSAGHRLGQVAAVVAGARAKLTRKTCQAGSGPCATPACICPSAPYRRTGWPRSKT